MINLIIVIIFIILLFYIFDFREQFQNEVKIKIVYYVFINKDRDWKFIVESQINEIINSNILSISKLYLVVCDEHNITSKSYFDNLLKDYNYEIDFQKENLFEYYGIKKLHELAIEDPNKIYLYFHTKGMVFHDKNLKRNLIEKYLTQNTLNNYSKALELFKYNTNINKIGMFPAPGYIWYNFFYVRGTYLSICNKPKITNDRFYYEEYLFRECEFKNVNCDTNKDCNLYLLYKNNPTNDNYSLFTNELKEYNNEDVSRIAKHVSEN